VYVHQQIPAHTQVPLEASQTAQELVHELEQERKKVKRLLKIQERLQVQCVAACCSVFTHTVAVCCSVFSHGCSKFKSGCRCSVLQPVAVCSHTLLQYVAVCLHTAAQNSTAAVVALCCSVLRNVAVCCSCSEFKSFFRKTTKEPFQ